MNKAISCLANLKLEATIVTDLAAAITAFGVYEALAITNADDLDPVATAKALRQDLQSESDPTTRAALMQQLAGYENADAADANRRAARSTVLAGYPSVSTTVLALLNQAITLATGYLATVVADENALWDAYAVTRTSTPISNSYRALIAQLNALKATETAWGQQPGGRIPSYTHHAAIAFFQ